MKKERKRQGERRGNNGRKVLGKEKESEREKSRERKGKKMKTRKVGS